MEGVRQLKVEAIDEMEARRHDTEYQLALCEDMMATNEILPFAFHRAVILLSKERRYGEALRICEYVKDWSAEHEKSWDGRSAMVWRSPKIVDCIDRIEKLRNASTHRD